MATQIFTTTRRTIVNRTAPPKAPSDTGHSRAALEIIGDADLVIVDGIMPRELANHLVTLTTLYQNGTLKIG